MELSMDEKKKEEKETFPTKKKVIAKKDWVVHMNKHHYDIKKGDDVSHIKTKEIIESLKKEQVI